MTHFGYLLIRLGVQLKNGASGQPQTQGRMCPPDRETLARSPTPALDLGELQRLLSRSRERYREHRRTPQETTRCTSAAPDACTREANNRRFPRVTGGSQVCNSRSS